MSEWDRARREFLYAAGRGSEHTARMYELALGDFDKFIYPLFIDEAGGREVVAWANGMAERGLSEATVNARLAGLASFYGFCMATFTDSQGKPLTSFNPAAGVKRGQVDLYGNSQPLSVDQVRALLDVVDRSTVAGMRDYAALLMGVYTGRRSEEIRALRWGDIQHTADGRVRYHWRGKRGKARWDDLPMPVYQAIRLYLDAAGRNPGAGEPVFVAHNGHVGGGIILSSEWLNAMVQRYARLAELPEWVHAHTLRHTAANLRAQLGRPLQEISMLLGHSSLRVTQIYLQAQAGFTDEGWEDVERLVAGVNGEKSEG